MGQRAEAHLNSTSSTRGRSGRKRNKVDAAFIARRTRKLVKNAG
jgi:hypothetical protein